MDQKDLITSRSLAKSFEKHWTLYDSDIKTTQDTFHLVLEGKQISKLAQEIKSRDGGLVALDIMGQGSRMVKLGANKTVAVCLDFNRDKMQPNIDRSSISEISGDLRDRDTWDLIDQWISRNSPFNFAIATPGDGVKYMWQPERDEPQQQVQILTDFIDNIVKRMTIGGVFLIESESAPRAFPRYFNQEKQKSISHPTAVVYDDFSTCTITHLPEDAESTLKIVKYDEQLNYSNSNIFVQKLSRLRRQIVNRR